MAATLIIATPAIETGSSLVFSYSGFNTGTNNITISVVETGGSFKVSGPSSPGGGYSFTVTDGAGVYTLKATDGVNTVQVTYVVYTTSGNKHGTVTIQDTNGNNLTNYAFTPGQTIKVQMTSGVATGKMIAVIGWQGGSSSTTMDNTTLDLIGNGFVEFTMPSQATTGNIWVIEDGLLQNSFIITVGGGYVPTLTINNASTPMQNGSSLSGSYSGFPQGTQNIYIIVQGLGTGVVASGSTGSFNFVVTGAPGQTYTLTATTTDGVYSASATFSIATGTTSNAIVTVTNSPVAVGTPVKFNYSGFNAGTITFSVTWTGSGGTVTLTGTTGSGSSQFTLGAGITGLVSIYGTDGPHTSPTVQFTISGTSTTYTPVITLDNASLQVGATLTGEYSGFPAGDTIYIKVKRSDGTYTGTGVTVTSPSGAGNFQFTDNDVAAGYSLTATDNTYTATPVPFTVTNKTSMLHGTVTIVDSNGVTIPATSYMFGEGTVIFVQMSNGVESASCTAKMDWVGGVPASTSVDFEAPLALSGYLDLLGNGKATITLPNQAVNGTITVVENGTVQIVLNISVSATAPPAPDKYSVTNPVLSIDVSGGGTDTSVATPPSLPVGSLISVRVKCTNNSAVKEDIRVQVFVFDPNGTPIGNNPQEDMNSHGTSLTDPFATGFDVGSQYTAYTTNYFPLTISGTWTAKIVVMAGEGNLDGGPTPTEAVYTSTTPIPICIVPAITGGIDEPTLSIDGSAAQDLPVTGISSGQSGIIKVVAHNTSGGPITMGLQLQVQGTDGTNLTPAIIKSTVAIKAGAAYTFTSPKFTFDLIGDYIVSANLYSEPDETDTIGTLAAEQLATGVIGPTTGTGVNGANGIMTDIGVKVYAPSLILSIVNFLVSRVVADVGKIAVETIPKDGLAEGNAVRASCVAVNDTSNTPITFSATFIFTNPDGTNDTQTISSTSPTKLGDSVQLVAPPSGNGWILSQEGSYLLSISLMANGTEVDTYSGTALTGVEAGVTGILGDIGALVGDMMLMMMMGIMMPLMAGSFGSDNNNGGGGMFGPPAKPKKPTPPPTPKNEPIYVEQPRYEQLPPYEPPYQQPPPYYPPQQPYQLESYYPPQQRYYPPQEPYYPPPQYYPQQPRYYQLVPPQPQAPPAPEPAPPAPVPQKSGFDKLVDTGTEIAKVAIPAAIAAAPLLLAL